MVRMVVIMLTTYFLKCIGEDIFKHQETSTIPFTLYLGLSSTPPTIAGDNVTEPASSTGYARVQFDNSNLIFNEATDDNIVSNYTKIYFPESILPWGDISHYVIFDDDVEGNLLMFGQLNETITVPIKTMVSVPIGLLSIIAQNIS